MATNKELRFERAREFMASAQKMLSRYEGATVQASDMSRIEDAARQAAQATSELNQLVGLLLAELEA